VVSWEREKIVGFLKSRMTIVVRQFPIKITIFITIIIIYYGFITQVIIYTYNKLRYFLIP
jgi:hypothetical protein